MKVPPRLVPPVQQVDPLFHEQRHVPRFPLPKEQVKFHFEDGGHKVCGIRDLSTRGVGIALLEHGESLLFPEGQEYQAELKLEGKTLPIRLVVRRVSAWSVGFEFLRAPKDIESKVERFLSPLVIGKSLRRVDPTLLPELGSFGLSAWYHGASNTDLYLWSDTRGGMERMLLCVGPQFLEWSLEHKLRTGIHERAEADTAELEIHSAPSREMVELAAKILEQCEVLDYRLVSFLKDQIRI